MTNNPIELKYNELDQLLAEINPNSLDVASLHGFLTSVICGPEPIAPGQWMPIIFQLEGNMPEFKTKKQADKITGTIMMMYNQINEGLLSGTFEPFGVCYEEDGKEVTDARNWAVGFRLGLFLQKDKLDPDEGEELKELVAPILILSDPEYLKETGREFSSDDIKELLKEFTRDLPLIVEDIFNYWGGNDDVPGPAATLPEDMPDNALPFARTEQKVGRNDLCPCGSDLKYKKCCGTIDEQK
ncbi:MAG: UPF0149 family protein [Fibrobacteria bacterium]|nr:UPF0149 family protein [Fibrobacteria bacterium]